MPKPREQKRIPSTENRPMTQSRIARIRQLAQWNAAMRRLGPKAAAVIRAEQGREAVKRQASGPSAAPEKEELKTKPFLPEAPNSKIAFWAKINRSRLLRAIGDKTA
ncbi:MAG: hypothetical protein Q8P02_03190 [Candidatus Micrarchaeota archaeon]|nr:hypothetical protein [Candidatus Micrarchaeota archaeon]